MSAVGHLMRRGVEAYDATKDVELDIEIPTWGGGLLAATAVLFLVGMFAIEYTYGRLIPTLLMVESPQALLFESAASKEVDASIAKNPNPEPELLLVRQQPITSSFRTTVKHLHSIGGFRARFRGIALFAIQTAALTWLTQIIAIINVIPTAVAPVLATIIMANLSMAWTHIVISSPSSKPWFKRMPSLKLFKKVALPTALLAVAEQMAVLVPAGLIMLFGFDQFDTSSTTGDDASFIILQVFAVIIATIAMFVLVVIPANVILTRVQASLLADNEETVVPFDRSFGGKVIPEIVGGTGVLSCLDAWKTFDWNSRVRLLKAYGKVMAIEMAFTIFFLLTIIGEVLLIVGQTEFRKLIPTTSEPCDGLQDDDDVFIN